MKCFLSPFRCQACHSLLFLLLASLLTACGNPAPPAEQAPVLKVVTRNGPTTFYEDRNGPTGFEYELVKRFADHLGVELEISARHNLEEIFQMLNTGQAHLAAAGLTMTAERQQRVLFSPAYMQVQQYLIYRQGRFKPVSPEQLSGRQIIVLAGSTHETLLRELQRDVDDMEWRTAADLETIDLLEMLNEGSIDATIIDSNEYTANKSFYPKLKIAFEIGSAGELGWAYTNNTDHPDMAAELARFFDQINADGTLKQLKERFYSHSEEITQISSSTFKQAVQNKLPDYRDLIQKVAAENNMDWRLLAAISYQESHWNPKAKSPTGVRGMMMLTLPTAREMRIKNRLDPVQSLQGGARYFNKIRNRLSADISEPDRTWLALAAYNVGLGHLEDAMLITQSQGGNPHKWIDVKDHLPLLRKRKWYQNTRHGYARGNEPVTYVRNIRHFYNILTWADLNRDRSRPPENMDQYLPESLRGDLSGL